MALQTVTLQLPDLLYRQIARRAHQKRRSVEDELVEVVSTALPTSEDLPTDVAAELEQLDYLTDGELWQAARATLAERDTERMQALLLARQRGELNTTGEKELKRLVQRADQTMLVRAEAAVLLKKRGYDIESLGPAEPA